jgi:hypothetical protein
MSDTAYSCSNAFADRVYAKYVCPVNTNQCGVVNTMAFPAVTASTTATRFTITNLNAGQTCWYSIKTACGAPAFKPSDVTKVEVEYLDISDAQTVSTVAPISGTGTHNSVSTTKRAAPPATGLPVRFSNFRGELGGNQVYLQNITTEGTTKLQGKSGRFDRLVAGRKAYGNPTQGDTQEAARIVSGTVECTPRTTYLAVTNVASTTASLFIDTASVTLMPEASGASFITMTFAAVFALFAFTLF